MLSHTGIKMIPGIVDRCEGLLTPCETRDGKTVVTQGSLVLVSGWIYCGQPVRSVTIVSGVRHLGVAEFGFARPDVALALGDADAQSCGFRGLIHTTDLDLGYHTLAVECVTEDGETYRSAQESITLSIVSGSEAEVQRAVGYIDTIEVADEVFIPDQQPIRVEPGDVVVVRGWILTSSREAGAAVALVLNGKIIPALYEFERADLVEIFGESSRRCGFIGKVDVDTAMASSAELTVGILAPGGTSFSLLDAAPLTLVKEYRGARNS